MLGCLVTPANVGDRDGAKALLRRCWLTLPRFSVLPRRWVVERTFSWLGKQRRLAKDYEERPASSVALIQIALSALMLRRLAPN